MKTKITMFVVGLFAVFAIIFFWIKELTKIEKFDIFGDIDKDEDWE